MFQMTEDLAWSLVCPLTAVFRFGPINPRATSADTGSLILTRMFFAVVGSNTTLSLSPEVPSIDLPYFRLALASIVAYQR